MLDVLYGAMRLPCTHAQNKGKLIRQSSEHPKWETVKQLRTNRAMEQQEFSRRRRMQPKDSDVKRATVGGFASYARLSVPAAAPCGVV